MAVEICSNICCLFIEIYWNVQCSLCHFKILLGVLNCDFEEISNKYIISLICFQLNRVENGNGDISPEVHFENSKFSILYFVQLVI
jgi:hypothetical protein